MLALKLSENDELQNVKNPNRYRHRLTYNCTPKIRRDCCVGSLKILNSLKQQQHLHLQQQQHHHQQQQSTIFSPKGRR
jgi:hypothetical protein